MKTNLLLLSIAIFSSCSLPTNPALVDYYKRNASPIGSLFHCYRNVQKSVNLNSQFSTSNRYPEFEYQYDRKTNNSAVRVMIATGLNEGYLQNKLKIGFDSEFITITSEELESKEYLQSIHEAGSKTQYFNSALFTFDETIMNQIFESNTLYYKLYTPKDSITVIVNQYQLQKIKELNLSLVYQ